MGEGKHEFAAEAIGKAIAINPAIPGFHVNLGIALGALGQAGKAADAFKAAIRLKPDDVDAHYRHAMLLAGSGMVLEAIAELIATLKLNPNLAAAHGKLGALLQGLGKSKEAVSAYRAAIRLKPTKSQTYANLAAALSDLGRHDEAIVASNAAIRLEPNLAHAYVNLGKALHYLNRFDEALAACNEAIRLDPGIAHAYCNLGRTLNDLGRLDEAIAAYAKAIDIKPDFVDAHVNEALVHLLQGNFQRGWRQYQKRLHEREVKSSENDYVAPPWQGQNLQGRTVLLNSEQGLGDTIQFSRYALSIQERGGSVVLRVPRHTLRLLAGLVSRGTHGHTPGTIQLIAMDDSIPACDYQTSLLSLPGAFGTTLQTIPDPTPYLYAEQSLQSAWAERIGNAGFKIGIVWQGNPKASAERGRSMPLSCFAPLAKIPGVRLISLQKGPGTEQLEQVPDGMRVETPGADFDAGPDAFIDTAALMMHLDLVISVDTATAHLAGALGRPVWLALQAIPHWVWMLERSDSPWYSSVRVFRQRERGNWESVMHDMAAAICERMQDAEKTSVN